MDDEIENETEQIKKPKLTRNELLEKARQAKKDKAEARAKAEANEINDNNLIKKINNLDINKPAPEPEVFKRKPAPKAKKEIKQEIKEFETKKDLREPEIIEEVVRVPGNRHKKIVKRTIEIEESETDEEIIEEIVKIPKMKKDLKISRDEMKKKLIENNKQRLYNDLFS
jgi:hypothetical protein